MKGITLHSVKGNKISQNQINGDKNMSVPMTHLPCVKVLMELFPLSRLIR